MQSHNGEAGSVDTARQDGNMRGAVTRRHWLHRARQAIVRFGLALVRTLRQVVGMSASAPDDLLSYMPKRDKIVEGVLLMLELAEDHGASLKVEMVLSAIFIADKEQLDTRGRPVFFDNYIATSAGPVGVTARQMLEPTFDWATVGFEAAPWTFGADELGGRTLTGVKRAPNLRRLSRSDVNTLSSILATVTSVTAEQMKHFTHHNHAYTAAWRDGAGEGGRIYPRLVADVRDDELIDDLLYASRHSI